MPYHTAGDLSKAESIYQQILQVDPNQPIALHLLGVIFHQVGEYDHTVDLIKKALTIQQDDAEIHNNLGIALRELGKQEDAFKNHQRAVALDPQNDSF